MSPHGHPWPWCHAGRIRNSKHNASVWCLCLRPSFCSVVLSMNWQKLLNYKTFCRFSKNIPSLGMWPECVLSESWHTRCITGSLETVQQRLWDNFTKQSKEEQGVYYCQLMALSAALARCAVNGHARAADYHCQLILHAISNHFYSVLRPKILATTEMVRSQLNVTVVLSLVISHRQTCPVTAPQPTWVC